MHDDGPAREGPLGRYARMDLPADLRSSTIMERKPRQESGTERQADTKAMDGKKKDTVDGKNEAQGMQRKNPTSSPCGTGIHP